VFRGWLQVTSFHFDIDSRARQAGRFIGLVRRELLRALSQKKAEAGISQQALARKLDVHRSLINRQLSGEANLTLRSLADLAWAMDMEISFELKKPETELGQNQLSTTSTVEHGQIKFINGGSNRNSFLAELTSPQAVSTEMTKSA
jgi:transcriptional regulator with XRE-family HTH domain